MMGLFDFFKPKWQRSNPKVRITGIAELNDETILDDLSKNDSDDSVRKMASKRLKKIRQIDELFKAIYRHKNEEVRRLIKDSPELLTSHHYERVVTPLHDAASGAHFEICATILENNVDPNILDRNGRTPLEDLDSSLWMKPYMVSVVRLPSDAPERKNVISLLYSENPNIRSEIIQIAALFESKGATIPNNLQDILDVWKQQ